MFNKTEKLFVTGKDSIIFPFKHKLRPHSAKAWFLDNQPHHHHHHHPSCNPIVQDWLNAEVIALPGGKHAVRLSWTVASTREIEWSVVEQI